MQFKLKKSLDLENTQTTLLDLDLLHYILDFD